MSVHDSATCRDRDCATCAARRGEQQPTTISRALAGKTPAEADAYLLRRLRDLENLVVQLGGEIEQCRGLLTQLKTEVGQRTLTDDTVVIPPPAYYDPYRELRDL